MKIVRSGFRLRYRERKNAFRFHGDVVVLILQAPFNQQKLLMHHNEMILMKKLWSNDGIGDPGFIFKAEEHEAFCRTGTLPRNHCASHANTGSVRNLM